MSSDTHYTVLARRFRPQAFADVAGQEHVATALRNAIRSGRVAHAYLFTGARGVGKTSMARILAKALNCPNVEDAVPCNQCDICQGIGSGSDVDVLEIDGASNRRIEDIRSIRANVGVRSMRSRFKVYIIDEVHMLTREAFNALLKTLEEPPPGVKFVFCTTEPEKVPDTILSRCQRFDFSAIDEGTISDQLRKIAASEGFDVADEAIELIARRARGSMRDSQSLFDQLLAFSEGPVTGADVHRMLGTAGDDLLLKIFDGLTRHEAGEVLSLLQEAFAAGVQPSELLDQCIGGVRDLIVLLSNGDRVTLCSVSNRHRETLSEQARKMGLPNLMAAFQILSETSTRIFRSTFANVLLEMALVQIALLEDLSAIRDLLAGPLPGESASAAKKSAATAQKKTADSALAQASLASSSSSQTLSTPFSDSSSEKILTQLIEDTSFTLSSALRQVESIAISEPNRLELILNSSYDFQRRVFEDTDNRNAIQKIVASCTGVQPVVTLRLTDGGVENLEADSVAPGSETIPATPPRSTGIVRRADPSLNRRQENGVPEELDEFVREVVEVFDARVERVISCPIRRGSRTGTDADATV